MRELPQDLPLFSLSQVGLEFGRDSVLHHLDLEVRKGESFAVLGPSGSGKSTLLKVMAGLVGPTSGEVRFQGIELTKMRRQERTLFRRRIGMTFQKSGLFDSLTCAENLHFPLRELTPLSDRERGRQVTQALADVGLVGQEALQIHEMSGGMQKRLGIARALILSPEVILYDDPTAGLDPITSRSILSLIHRMRKKYEMTLVIVTSDPSQAYQICDRVGFLWHGHFIETGTPDEMKASKNPAVRQFLHGLLEGPLS